MAKGIAGQIDVSFQLPEFNRQTVIHGKINQSEHKRKLCFCNFGPPTCEFENTCVKHDQAACFYAVKQEFIEELGTFESQHLFGCAPFERGSDGSHMTCNAWRFTHSSPRSIACCYEGNYCNRNLSISAFPRLESAKHRNSDPKQRTEQYQTFNMEALIFLIFGFLVGLCLILSIIFPIRFLCKKGKAKKFIDRLHKDAAYSGGSSLENGALLKQTTDIMVECQPLSIEDSGSGSGCAKLNQRTIAQDLQMREMFARGRYGELRKAVYRGSLVAVKIFYTTEEESWRNEREIYLSQMLNHENILQYIAADIMSNVESLTQMMLVTDYHPLGSLYDYLRADFPLCLQEALELAHSIISGVAHLHNPVRGTGGPRKPEIAHRDIKSKNVLVKRAGVCCLADFGLAVRLEDGSQILPRTVNIQVGTKRYMAPELLAQTLNIMNFDEFKSADIYSFSLVLWEIVNRIDLDSAAYERRPGNSTTAPDEMAAFILSAGQPAHRNGHQRIMSQSNSSGIVVSSSEPETFGFSGSSLITPSGSDSSSSAELMTSRFSHQLLLPHPNFADEQKDAECTGTTSDSALKTSRNDRKKQLKSEEIISTNASQQRIDKLKTHELPFQFIIETDPSFEQMHDIVCIKKIRPPVESEWKDGKSDLQMKIKTVCELMEECWSEQPRSRHTALKVKKELSKLAGLSQQGAEENSKT